MNWYFLWMPKLGADRWRIGMKIFVAKWEEKFLNLLKVATLLKIKEGNWTIDVKSTKTMIVHILYSKYNKYYISNNSYYSLGKLCFGHH